MWNDLLDTWWFRHQEVPAATVLDQGEGPLAGDLDGTLWWVDSELGDVLVMLEAGDEARFVDLGGDPVRTTAGAGARLYHPADAEGILMAELWRDRVEELGHPTEAQVHRPVYTASWDDRLVLGAVRPDLQGVRPGWKVSGYYARRAVHGIHVRIGIEGTTANLVIELAAYEGRVASDVFSPAVRSEILLDAVRAGAIPP
ncbi:MAG: hypothetical protein H6737_18210 [Alphaproteobacteria bacterium]|nr:hypothetical protein [Alphaproteobacteria bacterium]